VRDQARIANAHAKMEMSKRTMSIRAIPGRCKPKKSQDQSALRTSWMKKRGMTFRERIERETSGLGLVRWREARHARKPATAIMV